MRAKKQIILMGYSGTGYQGMQRNPGHKTIEDALFTALVKAGLVLPEAALAPNKVDFQRTARTDKGVHASRQVGCSSAYVCFTSLCVHQTRVCMIEKICVLFALADNIWMSSVQQNRF